MCYNITENIGHNVCRRRNESMKRKKRFGDRNDGYLVRDADAMHVIAPFILPNRADNEASMSEYIELAPILEYIEKKNADNPEFKYTFFHVICAALARVIAERPRMNRFYAGQRLYDRNEISFAFVVKRQFTDESSETLAIVRYDTESGIPAMEQIYGQVKKIVTGVRRDGKVVDGATDKAAMLNKLPRFLLNMVMGILNTLDYFGHYPKSFARVDPYCATCFISNLGSIKMNAQYHHLANRCTNSLFVIIGEKHFRPTYSEDGSCTVKEVIPLGITVDERIADGVYFAKTLTRLREILANPEILDEPYTVE